MFLKKVINFFFFFKLILILPNPTVITRNVTRNYADFALQVISEL